MLLIPHKPLDQFFLVLVGELSCTNGMFLAWFKRFKLNGSTFIANTDRIVFKAFFPEFVKMDKNALMLRTHYNKLFLIFCHFSLPNPCDHLCLKFNRVSSIGCWISRTELCVSCLELWTMPQQRSLILKLGFQAVELSGSWFLAATAWIIR